MGRKHKHSKDKLYKTVSELNSHHVGSNRDYELSHLHRRLKFSSCCLSLDTISSKPVGLLDKTNFCYIFDHYHVTRFLNKYKVHPITGDAATTKDLIEIIFHKNQDQYQCPITLKPLTQHSKIVANKKSGNVYSYEAYHRLNLLTKDFRDLLTGEPFQKCDIVLIQDPSIAHDKWNVSDFHYFKNKLKLEDDVDEPTKSRTKESDIIEASLAEYKQKELEAKAVHERLFGSSELDHKNVQLNKVNRANHSDGKLSTSVTSTVMQITKCQAPALLTDDQVLYPRIKKKGYVKIITNYGTLNVELFCHRTPKTCHNFLLLASRGYYNGTVFHRLVKNFMIQGGDPTGTGKGGESAWGAPFEDEIRGDLKHTGGGILAMANSGPNSNKSQFYITLKGDWTHLDGKHTIFGKILDGQQIFRKINELIVDDHDRPKSDVKIDLIEVIEDPYLEAQCNIDMLISDGKKRVHDDSDTSLVLKKYHTGVGSYIDIDSKTSKTDISRRQDCKSKPKIAKNVTKPSKYGDFSNW